MGPSRPVRRGLAASPRSSVSCDVDGFALYFSYCVFCAFTHQCSIARGLFAITRESPIYPGTLQSPVSHRCAVNLSSDFSTGRASSGHAPSRYPRRRATPPKAAHCDQNFLANITLRGRYVCLTDQGRYAYHANLFPAVDIAGIFVSILSALRSA